MPLRTLDVLELLSMQGMDEVATKIICLLASKHIFILTHSLGTRGSSTCSRAGVLSEISN